MNGPLYVNIILACLFFALELRVRSLINTLCPTSGFHFLLYRRACLRRFSAFFSNLSYAFLHKSILGALGSAIFAEKRRKQARRYKRKWNPEVGHNILIKDRTLSSKAKKQTR